MKTYDQLQESLTKSVEWKWDDLYKGSQYERAVFRIKGNKYAVTFDSSSDIVNISFVMNGMMSATGAGNAFAVFATIGSVIKDYLSKHRVKEFGFESGKHDLTRTKLYDTLMPRIEAATGFRSSKEAGPLFVSYKFKRAS